ncbi:MAG: hypothetical protein HZA79_09990 [Sphingobacteriales bacterium]|nr:hypothetical protein [Sphingobacteriales bacterium]
MKNNARIKNTCFLESHWLIGTLHNRLIKIFPMKNNARIKNNCFSESHWLIGTLNNRLIKIFPMKNMPVSKTTASQKVIG